MDDQRFDRITRVVAGFGTRRAIVRGLIGVASLAVWGKQAPATSAQYGSLGPGDACYDDSQCSPSVMDYSPLVCADNGFDYDGPLNCCTGEGGFCFSDEGCCGAAFCDQDSQRCIYAPVYGPSFPGAGGLCQTNDECQPPQTGLVCDYVSTSDDYRCCGYEGAGCGADIECCGWQVCWYGQCTAIGSQGRIVSSDARNPGDPCQTTDQCNRAQTGAICEYTAYTNDNRCCWYEGSLCTSGAECCGSRVCANGVCTSGGGSGPVNSCTWEQCFCDPSYPVCDPGLNCLPSERGNVCTSAQIDVSCSGIGCTCYGSMISMCDQGLMCCVQGDIGAPGVCLPVDQCYASGPGCTSEGCTCAVQNPYACDGGLICCGPGERDALGTCQYRGNC